MEEREAKKRKKNPATEIVAHDWPILDPVANELELPAAQITDADLSLCDEEKEESDDEGSDKSTVSQKCQDKCGRFSEESEDDEALPEHQIQKPSQSRGESESAIPKVKYSVCSCYFFGLNLMFVILSALALSPLPTLMGVRG